MKKGEMFYCGVDVLDLDDKSFRLFVCEALKKGGAWPFRKGEGDDLNVSVPLPADKSGR
jgi:hypothetical protein